MDPVLGTTTVTEHNFFSRCLSKLSRKMLVNYLLEMINSVVIVAVIL